MKKKRWWEKNVDRSKEWVMTYCLSYRKGEIPNYYFSCSPLKVVNNETLVLVPQKRDANASIGAFGGYSEFERSIEMSELFCQSVPLAPVPVHVKQ